MSTKDLSSNVVDFDELKHENRRLKSELKHVREKSEKTESELEFFRGNFEREKRKLDQYNREMETEMEKRDQLLEKHEQEIFDMEESRQRLLTKIGLLEGQTNDWMQQNQSLTEQLSQCQKQLQDERNKSIPVQANESALIDAEAKVGELNSKLASMKTDADRVLNANFELEDRVRQMEMELAECENDKDSLRSLIKCQQSEMQDAQEQLQELRIQLHQLQTEGATPDVAPRGNSLFAEVIDGKDKLEKQLAYMHAQNRKLRAELSKATKLAYDNAMNRISAVHSLSGPSLAVFNMVKSELATHLGDKMQLLEKLHLLEDAERRGTLKLARENRTEFNIFQENLHTIALQEKQRLGNRVIQLELREQELLNALSFEKQRADSVPQMQERLERQEKLLAYYEKAQMFCENDQQEKEEGF